MELTDNVEPRKAFEEYVTKKELELIKYNIRQNRNPFPAGTKYSCSPLMNFSDRANIFSHIPDEEPVMKKSRFSMYTKALILTLIIFIFVMVVMALI